MPPKLVCDTNILVSGFLWRGNEFKLLSAVLEGKAVLFSSAALYAEFVRVLGYGKLAPFVSDPDDIASKFQSMALFVNPREAVVVVKEDPADDKVLECAIAADADLIVSGDGHLLKLKSFSGIPIVTAQTALEKLK